MGLKFDGTDTLEIFRRAVLKALDDTASDLFAESDGWKDQDLPTLFKAIDQHVMRLAKRFDIDLIDSE